MTKRFLALGLLLWALPAFAHDETVSTSDVRIVDRTVVWRVDVGMGGLEKVVKLPATGADLTEKQLAEGKAAIAAYVARGLTIEIDGKPVVAQPGGLEPRYEPFLATGEPYIARVVQELRFDADQPIGKVRARVAFFSDITSQHRAMITVRWGDQGRQYVRLGVADLELSAVSLNPSRWSVLHEFGLWGMEHIFIGYDHIAFLLALLLVARGLRELVKIVTSFTVAHSLTLLLAALDLVRIPSQITEVLIAASIVYVAGENLWLKKADHRWWLTFMFGLVHGLGFATELRQRLAELPGSVLFPVVSFNVGVELGQLTIVSVTFPALILLRRKVGEARLVRWGSVPILVLGLLWLVQRLAA